MRMLYKVTAILSLILFQAVYSIDTLVISYNTNNPPFKFVNEAGEPDGILIDVWKLWSEKTGIPLKFIDAGFNETVEMVIRGDADVNSGLFFTEEREKSLDFTSPLLPVDYFLFVHRSVYRPNFSKNELSAYKIGVPEGFTADFAKERFPDSVIEIYSDFDRVYESALNKRIMVFISPAENLKHYLESAGRQNDFLKPFADPVYSRYYHGAVRKGRAGFAASVNAGLELIGSSELENIKKFWLDRVSGSYSFTDDTGMIFTPEEKRWLSQNPVIYITGDPAWPPNSFYDRAGNYVGIVPDLWDLISEKTGLEFTMITSSTWAEAIENIRSGRVMIIDCISETESRREFIDFSEVLFTSNVVLIGREDEPFINGLSDIGKRSLAVQEGVSEIELIRRDHPDLRFAYYKDPEHAYRDLSAGRIDLFLRHQSDFSYTKKEKMLTNLKIVGPTDYSRDYKVGVAKGNTELLSIINRAVLQITPEEQRMVFDKWHGVEIAVTDYSLIRKIVVFSLFFLAVLWYWNSTLAKEIRLRKKVQKELEEAKLRADDANEAKSRFLANMSHEIRTPMNAVIGFADLLNKTVLTTEQESYLATIKSAGSTLLNIIDDILDISKIEAHKIELNYSFFDIRSVVFDMKQFFAEKAMSKQLYLKVTTHNDIPSAVYLDEQRVRQILYNLISNAIKFTHTGGVTVSLSTENTGKVSSDIVIKVSDTGIGIKDGEKDKVFEAFGQAGETMHSKKYQGTGLGLSISRKFAELMNGNLTLSSVYGKGSEFTVRFNSVKTDDGMNSGHYHVELEPEQIRFRPAKVLIADDIASNRLLLVEFCKKNGLETLEAENGKEALEKAKLYIPDIVLMDMRMPVMDGYEAIALFKQDPVLKKIPVIAVTASVMEREMNRIKQLHFDGFIRKPVVMKELVNQIAKYIDYDVDGAEKTDVIDGFDTITQPDELLEKLNSVIHEEIEEAKAKHNFGQIKKTGESIKELGTLHGTEKLQNYASNLINSAESYDIEMIKTYLEKFEELVENIKTECGVDYAGKDTDS